MKNLKKMACGGILAFSLMAVAVPVAYAQDTRTDVVETDDDGFDWGWLGLLGLVGLAGLRGRNDRDRIDRDRGVNR